MPLERDLYARIATFFASPAFTAKEQKQIRAIVKTYVENAVAAYQGKAWDKVAEAGAYYQGTVLSSPNTEIRKIAEFVIACLKEARNSLPKS